MFNGDPFPFGAGNLVETKSPSSLRSPVNESEVGPYLKNVKSIMPRVDHQASPSTPLTPLPKRYHILEACSRIGRELIRFTGKLEITCTEGKGICAARCVDGEEGKYSPSFDYDRLIKVCLFLN